MATLDTMLMAGKEAPSEERPPTLYELALFGHLCGQAALERYVVEVVVKYDPTGIFAANRSPDAFGVSGLASQP